LSAGCCSHNFSPFTPRR